MAVDDHGLEAIRKAANPVTANDKSDYYLKTRWTDANGNSPEINDSGQMKVVLDGKVDDGNSSDVNLAGDAVFTGTGVETLDYAMIFISVFSDVASATDGLCLQVSSDNIVWRDGDCFTIPAGVEKTFSFQPGKKYVRVKYTNGASAQSTFDLQTILKKTNSKPSSHRIADAISGQDDATLQKSVLTALNPSGVFVNINATTSGNLRTTDAENGLAIAKGDVTNTTFIHKFGNAHDFDTSDGIVTVWDGADDANADQMQYVYSTTANIDSVSSDNAGDTFEMGVEGLDSNFEVVNQTVILNGQSRVALTTPLIRVYRMSNTNGVDNIGHIYCYVNGTISGGVPTDSTTIRAVMQPTNNQTLMAVYTVPAGKTAYLRKWYAATSGGSRSSNYQIELRARPFGGVFQLKHISSLSDNATSYIGHEYMEPEVFAEKTDIEMRTKATASAITGASVSAGFDIVLVDN